MTRKIKAPVRAGVMAATNSVTDPPAPSLQSAPHKSTISDIAHMDAAQRMLGKLKRSREWMSQFYPELELVFRQYMCMARPMKHGNESQPSPYNREVNLFGANGQLVNSSADSGGYTGTQDDDIADFNTPDTWALIRRKVARMSGNIVNLTQDGIDPLRAQRATTCLRWQWDKSRMQKRVQERHLTTSLMFGLSIKQWWWKREEYKSFRRVNPFKADPTDLAAIEAAYQQELININMQQTGTQSVADLKMAQDQMKPEDKQALNNSALSTLLAGLGGGQAKGKYLRIPVDSLGYVGPTAECIPLANFFPEPDFYDLVNGDNWVAIVRRRKKKWFHDLIELYKQPENDQTKIVNGVGLDKYAGDVGDEDKGDKSEYGLNVDIIRNLLRDFPKGDSWNGGDTDSNELGKKLREATNRVGKLDSTILSASDEDDAEYGVLEIHYPGDRYCVEYLAGGSHYLGKVRYPWEFETRQIPFTDLTFTQSILDGFGDSSARVIRNLVRMHSTHESLRNEGVRNVLRPLYGTTDHKIHSGKTDIRRKNGFSVILLDDHGDFKPVNDQAAHAGIVAGLQDSGAKQAAIQSATGESNMTMMAGVNPDQADTATGSKIQQGNQDILTRQEVVAYTACLSDEVNLMRRFNKSELVDELRIPSSPYTQAAQNVNGADPDVPGAFINVTPEDFQNDAEMIPEVGSMLAHDDDINMQRSAELMGAATKYPNLMNAETATKRFLIARGEGARLNEWKVPPPPKPEPPLAEPESLKRTMNITLKGEDLGPVNTQKAVEEFFDKTGTIVGVIEKAEEAEQQQQQNPEQAQLEELMARAGGEMGDGGAVQPDEAPEGIRELMAGNG